MSETPFPMPMPPWSRINAAMKEAITVRPMTEADIYKYGRNVVSWDTWLEVTIDSNAVEVAKVGNITSNLWDIMCISLGVPFCQLDKKIAKDIVVCLENACKDIDENEEFYIEYEPSNGWGDLEGARNYLEKLLRACRKFPSAIVRIWY